MSSRTNHSVSDHSFNSLHEAILQKRRSQLVNKRRRKSEEPEKLLCEPSDDDACSGHNLNFNHARSKGKYLWNKSMCHRLTSEDLIPFEASHQTESYNTGSSKDPYAWESLSDVEPIQFTAAVSPKQPESRTTKPGIFQVYRSPDKASHKPETASRKQKQISTKQAVLHTNSSKARTTNGIGKRKFFKNPSRIRNWKFDKKTFWTR